MGGQVQFMAESIPQAAAYHKQGKVKALAVTSRERNPALPDSADRHRKRHQGLRGGGLLRFPRAGQPAQGRDRQTERRLPAGAGQPGDPQPHGAQGADPAFLGSEDFAKYLAAEMPRWADAVKASGAKLD
jgi:hypothetical protein